MTNTIKRLGLLAILLAAIAAAGCTNPSTPAGHEGYVFRTPLVLGKMTYERTLVGPASTGLSWRLYVENVDMRAKSYKEDFQLLTRDNLRVAFQVSTRISLRPGSVREVVEDLGGTTWYERNVKEPLRTVIRRKVMEVSAIDIQLETDMVRQQIYDSLIEKYGGTPVQILSVDIGSIEFPAAVGEAIQAKIAKQQEFERQEYVLAKTRKEAAIKVLEALKVAKQQRIISETLDPLYVQRKAVQVYRSLAASPNKTYLVLPNTPDGTGMPLVHSTGQRKVLSASDEALLQKMEERYMAVAREAGPSMEPAPSPAPAQPTPSEPAPPAPAPTTPTPAPAPTTAPPATP